MFNLFSFHWLYTHVHSVASSVKKTTAMDQVSGKLCGVEILQVFNLFNFTGIFGTKFGWTHTIDKPTAR